MTNFDTDSSLLPHKIPVDMLHRVSILDDVLSVNEREIETMPITQSVEYDPSLLRFQLINQFYEEGLSLLESDAPTMQSPQTHNVNPDSTAGIPEAGL